jgi:mRNA interferase RelE/StbE
LIVEWHPAAVEDLAEIDGESQRRIRRALAELTELDDARQRLVPFTATLKGFWKLRVGDFRLVCQLGEREGKLCW